MPLTKENSIYRTHEIKSNMLCNLKTSLQKLYFFTKDGNLVKFIEVFEKSKLNVDSIDDNGNSLLTIAVQCSAYEIAEYLLNVGADVNSQNVRNLLIKIMFFVFIEIYELSFTLRSFP